MRYAHVESPRNRGAQTALRWGRGAAAILGGTVRIAIYSVLSVLEPVIVWVFSALTLAGLAMIVFFRFLVHARHFPTMTVLGLTVGCALVIALYYAVMELLLPE